MEDKKIIELYFSRNESALEQTGKKYKNLLCKIAHGILRNKEEVEECYNDTLLCAWDNIPPTRPEYLSAYLAKVIRNLAMNRMDYYMAKKRKAEIVELSEELENSLICHPQQESSLSEQELGSIISKFLRECNYEQRVIFVRRYWFGDSLKEIAGLLNITEGKVKTSLFRVRKKLMSYLEKEGIYL